MATMTFLEMQDALLATTPPDVRFWARVEKIPFHECWEWMGPKRHFGHGVLMVGGKLTMAHRFSFEMHYGRIVDRTLLVCHKCDNPGCVRPEHLFLGTHADNANDRHRKGRTARGVKHHAVKLTVDQVMAIRDADLSKRGALTALAKSFGVNRCTVGDIVAGRSWKHL